MSIARDGRQVSAASASARRRAYGILRGRGSFCDQFGRDKGNAPHAALTNRFILGAAGNSHPAKQFPDQFPLFCHPRLSPGEILSMLLSHSGNDPRRGALPCRSGSALGGTRAGAEMGRSFGGSPSFQGEGYIISGGVSPALSPAGFWGNVSIKKPPILLARSERSELLTLRSGSLMLYPAELRAQT